MHDRPPQPTRSAPAPERSLPWETHFGPGVARPNGAAGHDARWSRQHAGVNAPYDPHFPPNGTADFGRAERP